MELGLEWLESQRAVMYDERFQDYFLRYTDGQGNKIGKIYNEPINFGDQFFCELWALRGGRTGERTLAREPAREHACSRAPVLARARVLAGAALH